MGGRNFNPKKDKKSEIEKITVQLFRTDNSVSGHHRIHGSLKVISLLCSHSNPTSLSESEVWSKLFDRCLKVGGCLQCPKDQLPRNAAALGPETADCSLLHQNRGGMVEKSADTYCTQQVLSACHHSSHIGLHWIATNPLEL